MGKRLDAFLAHYASPYYDPAKARAYYLANRELKGKEKKLETSSQREAWGYASKQISEKGKAEKTAAAQKVRTAKQATSAAHQAKLAKLTADAQAARERIVANFKARLEQINKDTPIPKNASPKLRAFIEKQNAIKRENAGEDAKKAMALIGNDVRAAINNARQTYRDTQNKLTTDYKKTREVLDTKYKTARETEYENIRTKVK